MEKNKEWTISAYTNYLGHLSVLWYYCWSKPSTCQTSATNIDCLRWSTSSTVLFCNTLRLIKVSGLEGWSHFKGEVYFIHKLNISK